VEIPVRDKKTAHLIRRIALERLETVLRSLGALNAHGSAKNSRVQSKNRVLVTASIGADVEEAGHDEA
jgi:hypothetical protein